MQGDRRRLFCAGGDGGRVTDDDELLHPADLLNEEIGQCRAKLVRRIG
jgi:hypothetical protein